MKKEHQVFLKYFRKNEQIVIRGEAWESHGYICDADKDGIWLYQLSNSKAKLYPWNNFVIACDPCIIIRKQSKLEASKVFSINIESHQISAIKVMMDVTTKFCEKATDPLFIVRLGKSIPEEVCLKNLDKVRVEIKTRVARCRPDSTRRCGFHPSDTCKVQEPCRLSLDLGGVKWNIEIPVYSFKRNAYSVSHDDEKILIEQAEDSTASYIDGNVLSIGSGVKCWSGGGYNMNGRTACLDSMEKYEHLQKHGAKKFLNEFGKRSTKSYGDPLLVDDTKLIDLHTYDIVNGAKLFVSPHAEMYFGDQP